MVLKSLVIRVLLPLVRASSEACLDVTERNLKLLVPRKYKLDVDLPYPMDPTKGKAKFLKASSTLQITIPTVAPSKPAPPVLEEVKDKDPRLPENHVSTSDIIVRPCDEEQKLDDRAGVAQDCPGVNADGSEETYAPASQEEAVPDKAGSEALTENQQKWMEIHKIQCESEDRLSGTLDSGPDAVVCTKPSSDKAGELSVDTQTEDDQKTSSSRQGNKSLLAMIVEN